MDIDVSEHVLKADDGYALTAMRYRAAGEAVARIVVAGATAVPQGFYRRFALFAASRGFEVLTFDYRGIAKSRPSSLKTFRMNLLDWGRLDLAAAVEAMHGPELPLYMVGHSYGGHALGLLPNHGKLDGFYVFGVGAGWHGYMPLGERLRVLTMWNLVLPVLTWWKGYCPWKMLGMGEDLPVDAYRQWRHCCKYPRYFFDDPKMKGIERAYAAVRVPIVAANALDDPWATPQSRDAFMRAYTGAKVTTRDISPGVAAGEIGHMGYFREGAEALWNEVLDWFSTIKDVKSKKNNGEQND